ncbi:PH domain-containing protein [Candidatus Gottesmanbacteria bacterium]|nr:PH domain-containing protein [Candidatus Gottesmanbacteria bacterium]
MSDAIIPPSTPPTDSLKAKGKSRFTPQALSTFLFMPDGIRFETQEPTETIILLLRKHWITNFVWIVTAVILIVTPTVLFPAVLFSGIISNISNSFVSFALLVWYLITFSYILVNFLLWYFSVSIVTNERIIDIDFQNILHKKFAETRISRLEDVTMKTGGFIRALFNYGDVIVQTAATEAVFHFLAVPKPDKVVRIINQLMGKISESG